VQDKKPDVMDGKTKGKGDMIMSSSRSIGSAGH